MPLQNRVTPLGDIIATPARGLFMGNRGILHDAHQTLGRARWKHKAWIICELDFRNRPPRPVMAPNAYTELFFLDEAVALAAGHRPCAQCRSAEYQHYRSTFPGTPTAGEIDKTLHDVRLTGKQQTRLTMPIDALPDGAFMLNNAAPHLVKGDAIYPYTPSGYGPALKRPKGMETVTITPQPSLHALTAGYKPTLHPSVP